MAVFFSIYSVSTATLSRCWLNEQRQEFGTVFYSLMDAPKFTGHGRLLVFGFSKKD